MSVDRPISVTRFDTPTGSELKMNALRGQMATHIRLGSESPFVPGQISKNMAQLIVEGIDNKVVEKPAFRMPEGLRGMTLTPVTEAPPLAERLVTLVGKFSRAAYEANRRGPDSSADVIETYSNATHFVAGLVYGRLIDGSETAQKNALGLLNTLLSAQRLPTVDKL